MDPSGNRLLSMLPAEDYAILRQRFEHVSLSAGSVLHHPESTIRHVYFPLSGVVALTASVESGASACIGVVGREGFLGLPAFLGTARTIDEAIVQLPGEAVRVPAAAVELLQRAAVANVLYLYTQAMLVQTSQSAVCNRFHGLKERLARWLLSVHDRATDSDLPVTQEVIAAMVGSRRAGVSIALGLLQESGAVHLSRSNVSVLDRSRLEAAACECYAVVRNAFAALFEFGESRHSSEQTQETDPIIEMLRNINSRLIVAAIREQQSCDQITERSREYATVVNGLLSELRKDQVPDAQRIEEIERQLNALYQPT
jgi:CRP-like cAMP-binding protein